MSGIIVRPHDARVFLVQRSMDNPSWPGKWEALTEQMMAGETPTSCILRAIRVQLNAHIARFGLFYDFPFFQQVIRVYVLELSSEPAPDAERFAAWGWFTQDRLRRMEFAMDCGKRLMAFFDTPEYLERFRNV